MTLKLPSSMTVSVQGDGPVVVYLRRGAAKAARIIAQTHRVIAIDAGDAAWPQPERTAQTLVEALRASETGQLSLIAHGPTGATALHLALAFGERVDAVSLLAPLLFGESGAATDKALAA